jgi:hypothetical protein
MVDRHYSLNLKPWSARTLYVYAHADLAQKYSVGCRKKIIFSYLAHPCVQYLPSDLFFSSQSLIFVLFYGLGRYIGWTSFSSYYFVNISKNMLGGFYGRS